MQSVNFGHVSDTCESTLAHFCTFFHTCVHFTSNCLKHSKTWNLLTLEKKLVSQGGNKFKRQDSIQNFNIEAPHTEILHTFY